MHNCCNNWGKVDCMGNSVKSNGLSKGKSTGVDYLYSISYKEILDKPSFYYNEFLTLKDHV